jgi:hypothetical protein
VGIEPATVQARLKYGWTPEQALGLSPRQRPRKSGIAVSCEGKTFTSIAELANSYGIHQACVRKRLDSGWTAEQAVGVAKAPPRFRNQVGGAREHHWRDVEFLNEKAYPATGDGEYKVYVIRNTVNGLEYVGVTISDLAARLRGHRANVYRGVKNKLYNAMRHYGPDKFRIELVRNDAKNFAELQRQETSEIAKRGTLQNGYNVSPGGEIGTPKSIRVGGRVFESRAEAAAHFGIKPYVFNLRVSRLGWSPEEAAELTTRRKGARHKFEVNGLTFNSLKAAAEHFGIPWKKAHDRYVAKGWSLEQALQLASPPDTVRYRGRAVTAFGKSFPSLTACAKHFGIKPETLRNRVNNMGNKLEAAIKYLQRHPRPGQYERKKA